MRVKSLGLRVVCGAALATALLAPSAALARENAYTRGGHAGGGDHGQGRDHRRGAAQLRPGNLLVSGSEYRGADITPGQTVLPPGCTTGCVTATADGRYPFVFNNALVDPSFGVSSPIFLYQLTQGGSFVSRTEVPTNELVTSFSSKSELALNDSTSGRAVSFMGYDAPVSAIDVSNSNTPLAPDPTNPVPGSDYRAAAVLHDNGRFDFTRTNAYSGNNGRAAILNDEGGQHLIYTAGNAGNGSNPQPTGVVLGAGAQILNEQFAPEADQTPGDPTPLASFSVTQLGDKADKIGKDDNFRGLTVFDNVVYLTKGSGSNGVNTVYFVDTTGTACPSGSGLPAPGATLPTTPLAFDPSTVGSDGLPSNMCILKGFPTLLAKSDTGVSFPFGIWFANPHTLYVADEGDGDATFDPTSGTFTDAAAQTDAGLQKWVFDPGAGEWVQVDTIQDGLDLGQPYTVRGYPTGDNTATGLPWSPATDGLRNITGRVNRNGTVTIWAITSTVSGGGDQGADPNKLVEVTDSLSSMTPGNDRFQTVRTAHFGQTLRGVSFTPDTDNER
jgi:hypothetical protein